MIRLIRQWLKLDPKPVPEPYVHLAYVQSGKKKYLFLNGALFNPKEDCSVETWVRSSQLQSIADYYATLEEEKIQKEIKKVRKERKQK